MQPEKKKKQPGKGKEKVGQKKNQGPGKQDVSGGGSCLQKIVRKEGLKDAQSQTDRDRTGRQKTGCPKKGGIEGNSSLGLNVCQRLTPAWERLSSEKKKKGEGTNRFRHPN